MDELVVRGTRRARTTAMADDVLCLSHLRWGFVYQRPNHLMSRCARQRRVFFVEEPIFDRSTPRMEVEVVTPHLSVAVPHLPPNTAPKVAEDMQRALIGGLAARFAIDQPLMWFYTPMAVPLVRDLDASAVVYDCMDELSHFHGAPPALRERERELFAKADLVFTGGQSLYEAKRRHHPHVHAFPSSVDATHFATAKRALPDPEDQRAIPHPRAGFFGVVDERMDVELVRAVAAQRPDLHLVILGPVVKIDPARLPRAANIHWLGMKSYGELPAYLAGWDVAIMPFARNGATRYISPTKTLEYLAAGKPVVSTSIRDVVRPFGDDGLVAIADEPGAFTAAIDRALAGRGTAAEAARRRACDGLLAQTSWDRTWARMDALVEDVLVPRHPRSPARDSSPCSTI